MTRFIVRFKRQNKNVQDSDGQKLRYNYTYLEAKDEKGAKELIKKRFKDYELPDRLSLEYRKFGERNWFTGPFNARVESDIYFPTFKELEDWEDRQLLLFPLEKVAYTLRGSHIDDRGWSGVHWKIKFRAFSMNDAIKKVKKVYFGINLKDNTIEEPPEYTKLSLLEIKSKQSQWTKIFDKGLPNLPAGQASANAQGIPEEGVVAYSLKELARWGKKIRMEQECFPEFRRDIWDLLGDPDDDQLGQ